MWHGRVAIDVGASTGGFTDCLLQHGAKFVYAVDVGHGQLAWKIRQDPRVCVIEGTNIRTIDVNRFELPRSKLAWLMSRLSLSKKSYRLSPKLLILRGMCLPWSSHNLRRDGNTLAKAVS